MKEQQKGKKLSPTIGRGNTLSPFIDRSWRGEYGENCPVNIF